VTTSETPHGTPDPEIPAEMNNLCARLAEAEETLRAIRGGEVDALVLAGDRGEEVHLLDRGDRVYRQFIETIGEGTATVSADGDILNCNVVLARTLRRPIDQVLGTPMRDHVFPEDHDAFRAMLAQSRTESPRRKIRLKTSADILVPVYVSATLLQDTSGEPAICLVITDLEEVISAEATLRESEEREQRYRELLELAPVGIAVYCEGKIVFVNPAGARLLGADSEEQIVGKPIAEIIHPERLEISQSRITRMLAGEKGLYPAEDILLKLDGTPFNVEVMSVPVSYQGKPAVQVIVTDITERKRAEAELQYRNILLSTQQEASIDGILVVDENGRILTYNRRFVEIWGIPKELVHGKADEPVLQFLSDQVADPEAFLQRVQFLYEHRQETGHDEVCCTDGRILDRYSTPMFGPDEKYLGRVWFFHDNTEQKRTEAEQERLITSIEQVGEIVVVTDLEGIIQYVNPAFAEVTGYSGEEAIGQNFRFLSSSVQDQAFYQELWQTISSGRRWQGTMVNKRKDGELYTEQTTISPVFDAGGEIVSYVKVGRDVTTQLLLEDQLRQAQKMETVGQLAGGVAHDFNNMLQVIITYAEMSLAKVDPGHPLHKYLIEIRRASQRSAEITGQLLAFARKQTVMPKVLDLNDAVASAEKMIQRMIGEDIDLTWIPGHDLWNVKIDPTQLDQILANLAVNACDAIGGVGKLTIGTEKVHFDEAYCAVHAGSVPGEYVLLAVSDDGCGMDKKTQAHLFEPFFTTKAPGKGTGLGLATIYGIVKQNNGFVSVYSEPGQGTTFKVYLPRVEGAATAEGAGVEAAAPRGGTETIIVVEDETAILELAQESLEQLGYAVFVAKSPAEAIQVCGENAGPIHLLITDVVMPQMNGRQLAERLVTARPGLKCLYMSGYTADVIAHRGILDEGVRFIAKPFSLRVLGEKIREVLDG
jgi:PAS domain S-box-containing protein